MRPLEAHEIEIKPGKSGLLIAWIDEMEKLCSISLMLSE